MLDWLVMANAFLNLEKCQFGFTQGILMANASLNPEKCQFGFTQGILLGHIVLEDGVRTDLTKIEKIKNLPFPKTKK